MFLYENLLQHSYISAKLNRINNKRSSHEIYNYTQFWQFLLRYLVAELCDHVLLKLCKKYIYNCIFV